MPSVRTHRVAYAHARGPQVFHDVTLHLTPGWTGLVGANGAGKSTLLRLLAGELQPTEGTLTLEPEWAQVRLCPQEVESLTAEVQGFAADASPQAFRLRGQLRLEPAVLERWDTLSPGERKRWQVGAALSADPEVLLLDEPTNHLDPEARSWLVEVLGRFRGVGVVVSHDRELLDGHTTHTVRLHQGEGRLWSGGYAQARASWESERQERLQEREVAVEKRDKARGQVVRLREEHRGATADLSTGRRMRNRYDSDARTLAARNRAESAQKTIGRKVASSLGTLERATAAIPEFEVDKSLGRSVFVGYSPPPRSSLLSVELPELVRGGRTLWAPTRVHLERQARVRLTGPNGAGKTTLLNALLESAALPKDKVLFLPQELGDAELRDTLEEVRALPPDVRGRTLSLVAALGVDPDRLLASARPSPGEARKLRIALGLGQHAWALVLDEPTNHLDLPSIERLESALAAFPGALLVVTHDATFAEACTDTCWHLEAGTLSGDSLSPVGERARVRG